VPERIRITGGVARSRAVRSPRGREVRPTAARVREAVFSILGPRVAGARVLDLYAGAGTLGLEALSRGAASVVFVERAPRHAAVIHENLEALGLADRGRVLCADAVRYLARGAPGGAPFDLALVDPPYRSGALSAVLPLLFGPNIISLHGLAVVEHGTDEAPGAGPSWHAERTYTYGKTAITLIHPGPPPDPGPEATPAPHKPSP
jgi:16S rRNA (guanine966-N2)-methyltransferase